MHTPFDPSRPLLPRRWLRPLAAGALVAALLAALTAACVGLPSRQAAGGTPGTMPAPASLTRAAPASAATPAQVAERVTLHGARGPESERSEARDLARVKAEGRAGLVQHHLAVLAAQGDVDLYRGNSARLLVDGPQTFAAMKAAVAAATRRVLMEFYIVEDEGVAAEMGELLLRKAAEGVSVALLYDSVGSFGTRRAFFERLAAGGVTVCEFNPVNPLQRPGNWSLLRRNHRKMLAVDSQVAFTGGINLSNVYAEGSLSSARRPGGGSGIGSGVGSGVGSSGGSSGGGRAGDDDAASQGWRDTQVELRGPVVTAMAVVFRQSWITQGCRGTLPPAPALAPTAGERVVKLVAGSPEQGVNPTYTALLAATQAARQSIHLTMAYFAPGPDLVRALCDAARRGVDVVLVLPGRSDVSLVLHAARSYYAQLLEAGVHIHEMRHTVMHAKTAVIDDVFSTVGSSNLDWRSIVGNNEIDVLVLGDDFGQDMEQLFERDLQVAQPIDPAQWARRGVGQRLLEAVGRLVEPLL